MKNLATTGKIVLVLVSAAFFGAIGANAQSFAGQWGCRYAYAEYTAQGYLRGHSIEFNMMLYANGTFQAVGQMTSGAGVQPFQAQGHWQYDPSANELNVQGQSFQQFGMQSQFTVGGRVAPNGRAFHNNIEAPDSTGRYIAQRLSVVCQR